MRRKTPNIYSPLSRILIFCVEGTMDSEEEARLTTAEAGFLDQVLAPWTRRVTLRRYMESLVVWAEYLNFPVDTRLLRRVLCDEHNLRRLTNDGHSRHDWDSETHPHPSPSISDDSEDDSEDDSSPRSYSNHQSRDPPPLYEPQEPPPPYSYPNRGRSLVRRRQTPEPSLSEDEGHMGQREDP